jgi:hypothetical protein
MVAITSVTSHVHLKLDSTDGEPLGAGCRVLDAGSRVADAVDSGSLWVKAYRCGEMLHSKRAAARAPAPVQPGGDACRALEGRGGEGARRVQMPPLIAE